MSRLHQQCNLTLSWSMTLLAAFTAGSAVHWLSATTGTTFMPSTPPFAFHLQRPLKSHRLWKHRKSELVHSGVPKRQPSILFEREQLVLQGQRGRLPWARRRSTTMATNNTAINTLCFMFSTPLDFSYGYSIRCS